MNILYLLLAILKIVGIMIMSLFLILMVMIIVVLSVPIHYKLYINKKEEVSAKIYIRWLYPIISFRYLYNSAKLGKMNFKLFGKRIDPKKRDCTYSADEKESSTTVTPKPKNIPKNKSIIKKVVSFKYKREFIVDTLHFMIKILKHILPSDLDLQLEIGKEDPAETGKLMGVISMCYPLYYPFMNIRGNYEKECFYGTIQADGSIILGKLLYEIIKYIRLQSVKQLFKSIKTSRKDNKYGNTTKK